MGRLIDADAIPYTVAYKENWMDGTGKNEQMAWKSDIDKMPTVEPERGTGRWISCSNSDHWKCDQCGHRAGYWFNGEWALDMSEWLSDFCPNCGADMREEKHD